MLFSVGFGIALDIQNGKGGEVYKAALAIAGQSEDSYYRSDDEGQIMLLDAAMGKTICTVALKGTFLSLSLGPSGIPSGAIHNGHCSAIHSSLQVQ